MVSPVYALTLNDYKGDPITITSNHDYTGSTRPIVMLRFIGQCNIRGRQDSAALSLSGYRGLVIMMDESTVAGSSALSIGGNPTISIPDGWVRLDSNEITLTSWNGDPGSERPKRELRSADLQNQRQRQRRDLVHQHSRAAHRHRQGQRRHELERYDRRCDPDLRGKQPA